MGVTIPIVATDGVLGGKPRVEGTRVPVHQIGWLVREDGWDRNEAAERFGLSTAEVDAAVAYYDEHPDDMAALVAAARDAYDRGRAQSRAPD